MIEWKPLQLVYFSMVLMSNAYQNRNLGWATEMSRIISTLRGGDLYYDHFARVMVGLLPTFFMPGPYGRAGGSSGQWDQIT
jgi:hypothetical protein